MILVQRIKTFLLQLDTQQFYKTMAFFSGAVLFIFIGIISYYFQATHAYKKRSLRIV